jgi:hypothetical protein
MALSAAMSRLKRCGTALALSQLAWTPAFAADEMQRIQELEKKLAQSMAMIDQLATRLQQLEASKTAPGANAEAAQQVEVQGQRIERLEQTVLQVSEGAAKLRDLGTPLHGFADVGFSRTSRSITGRKTGFTLGNLDLYITPEFGDRVRSIVELVFEYGPDAIGVATDLERLQFGYTFSDAATLWVGRFHTPYGYWNTAFHHGQQIQTAATRPRFIDFEDKGGIMPAHAVGLLASGSVRAGAGRLQYDGYLANGNRIVDGVLDFNAFGDNNQTKLVGGNLRYGFGGALEGLTLGLHGFTQKVAAYQGDSTVRNDTKVTMAGAFAVLDKDNWELLGEYYRFRNQDLSAGTGSHSSWAGFGQAGYTFSGKWTPYGRLEKAVLDQADAYFAAQESGRSYRREAVGLRYDLNSNTAIKLELDRVRQTQRDASLLKTNETRLQFAVRF